MNMFEVAIYIEDRTGYRVTCSDAGNFAHMNVWTNASYSHWLAVIERGPGAADVFRVAILSKRNGLEHGHLPEQKPWTNYMSLDDALVYLRLRLSL